MMGNYLSLWAPEVPSWVAFKSTGHSRGDGEVPHDTMQPSIAPSEAEEADGPRVQRLNTAQWAHRDAFTLASGQDAIVTFNWDIKLLDSTGSWVYAKALLDTQCHVGNWISMRLVWRLGMSALVTTDFEPPEVIDANGRPVHACGVVDLTWQWHPRGTRIYECPFYVLPDSEYLDVLFGVDSIVSMNLIQANPSAIVTLVEHKKLKEGEKAAIATAKERQRQEKAALAERKKQQSKQGGQKKGAVHGQQASQHSSG